MHHGYVFSSSTGGVHGEGFDANWQDRKKGDRVSSGFKTRAGITRPVRFHDLRQ
jgi:hypothetical protein